MVQYIIDLANIIKSHADGTIGIHIRDEIKPLAEELNRLDPRNFLAASRTPFVLSREKFRAWAVAANWPPLENYNLQKEIDNLNLLLLNYLGEGSYLSTRTFSFVFNADLRILIERDYKELALRVFPSGAWKSSVVLAGSITEAILFDALTEDPAMTTRAESSRRAPKYRGGPNLGQAIPLSDEGWSLYNFIEVAMDLGLISADRAKTFDVVLRDYRNFVHPRVELRKGHPCSEAEALMSKGALDALCNHLDAEVAARV